MIKQLLTRSFGSGVRTTSVTSGCCMAPSCSKLMIRCKKCLSCVTWQMAKWPCKYDRNRFLNYVAFLAGDQERQGPTPPDQVNEAFVLWNHHPNKIIFNHGSLIKRSQFMDPMDHVIKSFYCTNMLSYITKVWLSIYIYWEKQNYMLKTNFHIEPGAIKVRSCAWILTSKLSVAASVQSHKQRRHLQQVQQQLISQPASQTHRDHINKWTPQQNGTHIVEHIFMNIFFNEKAPFFIKISLCSRGCYDELIQPLTCQWTNRWRAISINV